MSLDIKIFEPIIREIVIDISIGNYRKIEKENRNGRVEIDDLARVVNEYGCTIIPLPSNAFEFSEKYFIEEENRLDIYIPLWTVEEGRSDLILLVICYIKDEHSFVEINDLRVL